MAGEEWSRDDLLALAVSAQSTPTPFMQLPALPPSMVWNDAAPMNEPAQWVAVKAPADFHRITDDICRDDQRLFGYDRETFLRKQYRDIPTEAGTT